MTERAREEARRRRKAEAEGAMKVDNPLPENPIFGKPIKVNRRNDESAELANVLGQYDVVKNFCSTKDILGIARQPPTPHSAGPNNKAPSFPPRSNGLHGDAEAKAKKEPDAMVTNLFEKFQAEEKAQNGGGSEREKENKQKNKDDLHRNRKSDDNQIKMAAKDERKKMAEASKLHAKAEEDMKRNRDVNKERSKEKKSLKEAKDHQRSRHGNDAKAPSNSKSGSSKPEVDVQRQKEKEREKQKERERRKEREKEKQREKERELEKKQHELEKKRLEKEKERELERERERQKEIEKEKQREKHREKEKEKEKKSSKHREDHRSKHKSKEEGSKDESSRRHEQKATLEKAAKPVDTLTTPRATATSPAKSEGGGALTLLKASIARQQEDVSEASASRSNRNSLENVIAPSFTVKDALKELALPAPLTSIVTPMKLKNPFSFSSSLGLPGPVSPLSNMAQSSSSEDEIVDVEAVTKPTKKQPSRSSGGGASNLAHDLNMSSEEEAKPAFVDAKSSTNIEVRVSPAQAVSAALSDNCSSSSSSSASEDDVTTAPPPKTPSPREAPPPARTPTSQDRQAPVSWALQHFVPVKSPSPGNRGSSISPRQRPEPSSSICAEAGGSERPPRRPDSLAFAKNGGKSPRGKSPRGKSPRTRSPRVETPRKNSAENGGKRTPGTPRSLKKMKSSSKRNESSSLPQSRAIMTSSDSSDEDLVERSSPRGGPRQRLDLSRPPSTEPEVVSLPEAKRARLAEVINDLSPHPLLSPLRDLPRENEKSGFPNRATVAKQRGVTYIRGRPSVLVQLDLNLLPNCESIRVNNATSGGGGGGGRDDRISPCPPQVTSSLLADQDVVRPGVVVKRECSMSSDGEGHARRPEVVASKDILRTKMDSSQSEPEEERTEGASDSDDVRASPEVAVHARDEVHQTADSDTSKQSDVESDAEKKYTPEKVHSLTASISLGFKSAIRSPNNKLHTEATCSSNASSSGSSDSDSSDNEGSTNIPENDDNEDIETATEYTTENPPSVLVPTPTSQIATPSAATPTTLTSPNGAIGVTPSPQSASGVHLIPTPPDPGPMTSSVTMNPPAPDLLTDLFKPEVYESVSVRRSPSGRRSAPTGDGQKRKAETSPEADSRRAEKQARLNENRSHKDDRIWDRKHHRRSDVTSGSRHHPQPAPPAMTSPPEVAVDKSPEPVLSTLYQGALHPPEFYLRQAKALKHEADQLNDKLPKALKYVEAVLSFVLHGNAMECCVPPTDPNKVHQMFRETLTLLKHICKLRGEDQGAKERRLFVLSLRVQSLICHKLYKLKHHEVTNLKRAMDDFNRVQSSAKQPLAPSQAPSPLRNGWTTGSNTSGGRTGTGIPSPHSPTPSPAGSVCSVGSMGSEGARASSTNNNPAALSAPSPHAATSGSASSQVVTLPSRQHRVTQQYLTYVCQLAAAHEHWENAELAAAEHKDFFASLSRQSGTLSMFSSMLDLVNYVSNGIHRLRENS